MRSGHHLAHAVSELRTPLNQPHAPADWKEWYHFVLIDPREGLRLLANVSLSGVPDNGQITVTVLATLPTPGGVETYGFTRDANWERGQVCRAPFRASLPEFHCMVDGPSSAFRAVDRTSSVALTLEGQTLVEPLLIPEYLPFGTGFIGWGLVPGVRPSGELRIGGRRHAITSTWFCYHDHNYGRFRWGGDVGWIWFVLHVPDPVHGDIVFVLHRGNSRDLAKNGAPYLFVYERGHMRKVFMGASVEIRWKWTDAPIRPPRMPGTMASLFAGRVLRVPEAIEIRAADDRDALTLHMSVDALMELILPDNRDRQYSFIEEMSGTATVSWRRGTHDRQHEGIFYAEFVH